MGEFLQSFLGLIAASGVLIPLFLWLFKRTYESKLSQDLEAFRAQLSQDLEASKAELSRFAVEHQIQFSHLHTKRAEAIAESYRLLGDVLRTAAAYTDAFELVGTPPRQERAVKASEALQAARDYLLGSTIYFPASTAKEVEALIKSVNKELVTFQFSVDLGPGHTPDFEQWRSISSAMTDKLPKVLESLSNEFRMLLDPRDQKSK